MPPAVVAVAGVIGSMGVGAVASTVIGGLIVGAAVGAASAALTGGDIKKGAMLGGITGGVLSGLSVATGGAMATKIASNIAGTASGATGSAVAGSAITSGAGTSGQAAGLFENAVNLGAYNPVVPTGAQVATTVATTAPSAGLLSSPAAQYGLIQAGGNFIAKGLEPSEEEKAKALAQGQIAVDNNRQNIAQGNKITLDGMPVASYEKSPEFTETPLWRKIAESPDWKEPLLKRGA